MQLNPQQDQAVHFGNGPLVVLAGAGTGKTRVLVNRVAHLLVERQVSPQEILAVTFTNKAAGEMKERLTELVDFPIERMWVGTFHGISARLLRRHGHAVGVPMEFTIFDDDDQKRVLARIIKDLELQDEVTPGAIRSRIGRAKHEGLEATDIVTGSYLDDLVAQIYPLYKEQLIREKALDFGDLLVKALELVRHPKIGPEIANQFRYVLVDEFQDTNRVQYLLVKAIAAAHGNITVVGDDDQCIYGWRGAEPRNLLDFSKDFHGAVIVPLEQNYRSTQHILDAANAIIENNDRLHPKRLWTEGATGDLLSWYLCDDERAEATTIAGIIDDAVAEGLSMGDIAILYRKHSQSRVLEEYLRRADIPYRVIGGTSFFQRKEIKDVLAYLRLVLNPAADSCFERIVNSPARGIGKTTLGKLQSHARRSKESYWNTALLAATGQGPDIGKAGRRRLGKFIEIIEGLRASLKEGATVAQVAQQCVQDSGYRKKLEDLDTPEALDRLSNLQEFVSMAAEFDEEFGEEGTLHEFDERVALSSVADQQDGRGHAVSLMTVHAAKGLEFPLVCLVGLEDGVFPSLRSRMGTSDQSEQEALQEERRLAYVAMTRAKQQLVLSSARSRREWGDIRFNDPSRFLDEIPEHLVVVHGRQNIRSRSRNDNYYYEQKQEQDFDQSIPDDVPVWHVESFETGESSIAKGSWVSHKSFGRGTVIESHGAGDEAKLLINFKDAGLKTVIARFVSVE